MRQTDRGNEMIHNQAKNIAAMLANKKIIDKTSHEVYTYGLELLISAFINILLVATVSIIFCRYYDWLLFLAAFIPLRTTAGGYHAKSHLGCIVIGTLVFAVFLAINQLQINWVYIIPIIAGFSFVTILLFSPVEAHNKKLKYTQNKRNRRLSINIAILNIAIAVMIFIFNEISSILSIYYLGVLSATLSMLVVKANKSEGSENNETREELAL